MGDFFLSWCEKPCLYFRSVLRRVFSKFRAELQWSGSKPSSAGVWCSTTVSSQTQALVKKINLDVCQNPEWSNVLTAAISKGNFSSLWWNASERWKICLAGLCDGVDGGGWREAAVVLLTSIRGRAAASLSQWEPASPWLASVWLLLVKAAAQSSPGGTTAVLVCRLLAVCLLESSVFHGREDRRAACGLRIVLGYSLTFLSLPFTEASN